MDLTFQDPGLEYSLAHILDFQAEGMSDYWRDGLFLFYPSWTGRTLTHWRRAPARPICGRGWGPSTGKTGR